MYVYMFSSDFTPKIIFQEADHKTNSDLNSQKPLPASRCFSLKQIFPIQKLIKTTDYIIQNHHKSSFTKIIYFDFF